MDSSEIGVETSLSQEPNQNSSRQKIKSWLNRNFRITMTDDRILIGLFLCTDCDANIILGMCTEYRDGEERSLGLVIVPKKAITSIEVDSMHAGDKEDLM